MAGDMGKYIRAGLEAFAPGRTDEVAASLTSGAQAIAERMAAFAEGFLEWSAEARAGLLREVREVAARQVGELGLATKDQLADLRRRVERLERASSVPSKRSAPAPNRSASAAPKRSTPGSPASRRASAASRRRSR